MRTASHCAMPPRAAYIHVPFCARRCGYCNFTLVAGRDDLIDGYLQALATELSWLETPREVDTLFLGGGTPTHLPPAQLRRLLTTVLRWHPLATDKVRSDTLLDATPTGPAVSAPPVASYEFSIEANPIDVTLEKVQLLTEFGITRLSLGAQSFDDDKLRVLERDHRAEHIIAAFELARRHVSSLSLDLIFAAPGETLDGWQRDLQQAVALPIDHVSTYGLTFEKGTSFWSRRAAGQLPSLDEEAECGMYSAAIDALTAAGFEHYEVSNFARPGHRCRHNETYWTGGEYYAAGPGAARHVAGRRETNHRSTTTYIRRVLAGQSPVAESETLTADDRARELLVFGLRRLEGVDRDWFVERAGIPLDDLGGQALRRHIAAGLLADDGRRVRLTRRGLFVSDSLWPEYLG